MWLVVLFCLLYITIIPLTGNSLIKHVATILAFYAYISQTWNIVGGLTGLFSGTHGIWQGLAAYCTIISTAKFGLPIWTGLLLTIAVNGALAFLIGIASSRMVGLYFVMCSIAVGQAVYSIAVNWMTFTGGNSGRALHMRYGAYREYMFFIIFAMTVCMFALFVFIRKSRFGSLLVAVRENELFAKSLGINTSAVKVMAVVTSAVLAGIGGYAYIIYLMVVHPSQLTAGINMKIMVVVLVGGIGTAIGPALGCLIILLDEVVRMTIGSTYAPLAVIVYAVILITVVMFRPKGLASLKWFQPKQRPSVLRPPVVTN